MLKKLAYFGLFVGGVGVAAVSVMEIGWRMQTHIDNMKRKKRDEKAEVDWPDYEEYSKDLES